MSPQYTRRQFAYPDPDPDPNSPPDEILLLFGFGVWAFRVANDGTARLSDSITTTAG